MIEIEHGCIRDPRQPNTYHYVDSKLHAYVKDYQSLLCVEDHSTVHTFHVGEGQHPEVGDFISGDTLVKRTKPKVNNDWSKWKDKDL